MGLRVTLMGTGTSLGVPEIGCGCAVCLSDDPKNKRLRTGVLVQNETTTVLIDMPPDLRQQALRYGVSRLDSVLLTHHHADHVLGLDDLRRYNALMQQAIEIFTIRESAEYVEHMFPYVFDPVRGYESFLPRLTLRTVDGPFQVGSLHVTPVPVMHNKLPVFGFRIGGFAFLTDCNNVPDASRPLLEGLDVLVLGALRHRPHPAHFTLAEAVEEARRISAARTYFTHIAHDLDHHTTNAGLPDGMALAYDGLTLEFD